MYLSGRLAAAGRLLLCVVACAPLCCAGTLISITGAPNGGFTISKSYSAGEVTFSTNSSYNNVLFSGVMDQGPSTGRVFLVNLGTGVTVAAGSYSVTASGNSNQMTSLLTVSAMYAGSYALEVFTASGNFNWEGTNSPTITTGTGVTLISPGRGSVDASAPTASSTVAPAADFTIGFNNFEMIMTGVPEPPPIRLCAIGLAGILCLAGWRRHRPQTG